MLVIGRVTSDISHGSMSYNVTRCKLHVTRA